ncbi:hypothetical protein KUTeg_009770 [Tegillarca granosa]|uniref:G-protein coupled receptors family 1 profile domain-containing protein n=1 Tax=Tegillarca granosa TaxID=220873 RepID=A0ABQ9F4V9_TEGGR|nr:hypothetical protein KUTeg_009770 [Tegillarca granosa]
MNGTKNAECFSWLEINNFTTLYDINQQFTERHLGGIIFTGILMIFGVFGNLTVLWIYIRRFKMSNYRTYTIWLALMDVGNCLIGMPFLIYYMSHYLIFPSSVLCKLGRFVNVFTTNCSAYILVVISYDRYRKICKPLQWQFTQKQAKISCMVATCIGMVTSWPALVLYGIYTVDTMLPNVRGDRCWTDDTYRDQVYPSVYYIGLYVLNLSVVPVFLMAYVLILRFLYRHQSTGINIRTRKTTFTLLAVTVAFLLSGVPHYSLVVTTRIKKDFNCKMTFFEGFVYYSFVFSILLNNAVNPFIYGFLDVKFRREIVIIYKSIRGQALQVRVDSSMAESGKQEMNGDVTRRDLTDGSSMETYLDRS